MNKSFSAEHKGKPNGARPPSSAPQECRHPGCFTTSTHRDSLLSFRHSVFHIRTLDLWLGLLFRERRIKLQDGGDPQLSRSCPPMRSSRQICHGGADPPNTR